MKDVKILICLIGLIVGGVMTTNSQINQEKCEAIYEQWHQILDSDLILAEPQWFSTNGMLAPVVREFESNKIAMAYFLCEKMARTQYADTKQNGSSRLYQDVLLLHEVAGIDLMFYDVNAPLDHKVGEPSFVRLTAKFQEDWRSGIYQDPSQQVKALCDASVVRRKYYNI